MKKITLYACLFLAAGLATYFFILKEEDQQVKVETVKAVKGTINHIITATGTIEPLTQVEVGTQVSGVIQKIYVDYNSKVKSGQLLAELDKTNLSATLEEANASLNTALNEQNYLQKNFDRIAKLYQSKKVSQVDYEEAEYKLNNSKGVVAQRKSDVSRAKTNLGYANIYSPIDGVVLSRSVDEGQTVAASYSTPTLFTIAQDLKQMQVEAAVDEADIGQVKVGQRVIFSVDAYPDDEFSGTITQVRLEPIEESNVITYTVIIKAENPDLKLMPGLTASISAYTLELSDVLTLQAKALRFEPDRQILRAYMSNFQEDGKTNLAEAQNPENNNMVPVGMPPKFKENHPRGELSENEKIVWIKNDDDIRPQKIVIGESDGVQVQIIEGLAEGDEVVYAMEISDPPRERGEGEMGEPSSPFMPQRPGSNRKK
ncbi:efflux RND transporter periplasmic adaptor subunit [Flexithrix dorotheae]|uniref:efflux RND transporter periplasmic adaptor subunit n=1 Tax=Flexithrix dorotheae TaxID=70993 RepID=UPI00037F9747|nr:efflux RND transporter periplasmic adaptor subunit [Flexithrix dorotheae]